VEDGQLDVPQHQVHLLLRCDLRPPAAAQALRLPSGLPSAVMASLAWLPKGVTTSPVEESYTGQKKPNKEEHG
jgi:hypothetical protein